MVKSVLVTLLSLSGTQAISVQPPFLDLALQPFADNKEIGASRVVARVRIYRVKVIAIKVNQIHVVKIVSFSIPSPSPYPSYLQKSSQNKSLSCRQPH
jgi:hypothetical protein